MFTFLLELIKTLFHLVLAIGLPFAVFLTGETVCGIKYPHGESPFSGVGIFGAITTFALWATWQTRSLQVNFFVAAVRVLLCYIFAFLPTFWFIKSDNAIGAAVYASLAYYVTGCSALNVWKRASRIRSRTVIRGPETDYVPGPKGGSRPNQAAGGAPLSSSVEDNSYEKAKRSAGKIRSRETDG